LAAGQPANLAAPAGAPGARLPIMRSLVIAILTLSCTGPTGSTSAGDEARHAPVAPVAVAPAVVTKPVLPAPASVVAIADPRDATRRTAHDVLAEHCGACHESHRSTAVAKALAIFDLDQPDWPSRFDDHRFDAALNRLTSKPAAAREAFIAFRDAERAQRVVTTP
jgi:mono/diheme cytochrome c family protein